MAKRKKIPKRQVRIDRFGLIDAALLKCTKAELVDLLITIARKHDDVCRRLESKLRIEKPIALLLADISAAIDRATNFDERMLNSNFDVDWQAYEEVRQGFQKLLELGEIEQAKSLALELMKGGSYQVGCSDEGLMSDELEACLKPVIRAVKTFDAEGAKSWATAMLEADRVDCICDSELKKLIGKVRK